MDSHGFASAMDSPNNIRPESAMEELVTENPTAALNHYFASKAALRQEHRMADWTPNAATRAGTSTADRKEATDSAPMTPSGSWCGHTNAPGFNTSPVTLPHSRTYSSLWETTSSSQSKPQSISNAVMEANSPVKARQRKVYKSLVLKEGEALYKPWQDNKKRRKADLKAYWIFLVAVALGIAAAGALVYTGIAELPKYNYCLVLDEQFSGTALDTNVWFHERETGGFGNHEFEWTTNSINNSYVANDHLYIVPTLTSDTFGEAAIIDGYTLNLTADNSCTAANRTNSSCAVVSNITAGVILPPIQSARLITNFSTTIRYGRVEVRAKMPTGDWIWPAVWMMPKNSVYGQWPRSGEIDIFESKGNAIKSKSADGPNRMKSALHWGPRSDFDAYYKTLNERQLYRDYYDQEFHTFGLEWTPEGIYTWEGSPVNKVFAYRWENDFWTEGNFPGATANGTTIPNPWPENNNAAPFDQEFYLILSVAVGGTNGFFDESDKPWSNADDNARATFWANRDEWYPSWPTNSEDRAMVVDYVKMWSLDDGVACAASA